MWRRCTSDVSSSKVGPVRCCARHATLIRKRWSVRCRASSRTPGRLSFAWLATSLRRSIRRSAAISIRVVRTPAPCAGKAIRREPIWAGNIGCGATGWQRRIKLSGDGVSIEQQQTQSKYLAWQRRPGRGDAYPDVHGAALQCAGHLGRRDVDGAGCDRGGAVDVGQVRRTACIGLSRRFSGRPDDDCLTRADRAVFPESRIPQPEIRQADVETSGDGAQGVASLNDIPTRYGRFRDAGGGVGDGLEGRRHLDRLRGGAGGGGGGGGGRRERAAE